MTSGSSSGRRGLIRIAVVGGVLLFLGLAVAAYPGEIRWETTWEWRGAFLKGLGITVVVSVGALAISLLLGTAAGLARISKSITLQEIAATYVQLVRGTPFLVQVYIWYFCIATLLRLQDLAGNQLALVVGILGLGVFGGAYVTEIVRAAVESIDRGQWEAARSLGLSHRQTLLRVILPQSIRRMIPPLTGEAVSLVKESSLLSLIGVAEMTYHAANMRAREFDAFASFIPLAALYLCVTLPLALLTRWMEHRLGGEETRRAADL